MKHARTIAIAAIVAIFALAAINTPADPPADFWPPDKQKHRAGHERVYLEELVDELVKEINKGRPPNDKIDAEQLKRAAKARAEAKKPQRPQRPQRP